MKQEDIRKKYEKLENRRQKIVKSISTLQEKCLHPSKEKTRSGRDADGDFWTDYICNDCNKSFFEY